MKIIKFLFIYFTRPCDLSRWHIKTLHFYRYQTQKKTLLFFFIIEN